MARLKYYSLGGQDEKFRFSGVLELNGDIFILNAGGSCVNTNLYEIDDVIPDYSSLIPLKPKIRGLFIGVPKELNISSLPYFLDVFPEVPIFTNSFGESIIRDFLERFHEEGGKKYNPNIVALNLISEHAVPGSNDCKILPIKVAASLPNSLAWAFKFSGSDYVVFMDEFLMSSENVPCRENQLNFLFQNLKNKVSLLIVGTQSCATVPSFSLKVADNFSYLKKLTSRISTRLNVAAYKDDWHTLFNLSRIARIYEYDLLIYPLKTSRMFNSFITENKLKNYSLSVSEETSRREGVVQIRIITGTHNTLYSNLRAINSGEVKDWEFLPTDVTVFMTSTFTERELEEISMINEIAHRGGEVLKLPSTIVPYMAGTEDLKLLVNYLSPYHVIPVNGFYKDYVEFTKALTNVMNIDKIYFLENGQYVNIEKKNVSITENPLQEIYVGNKKILDINRITIYERRLIAQSGVVLVSVRCNSKKNIVSNPMVQMLSVFSDDFSKKDEVLLRIQTNLKQDISKYLQQNSEIENKGLKQSIRKSVYNSLDPFIYKKPAVVSVISHIN
ncbi:conserved hypothetical protein [Mycoplasma suis KI3806]|uniref:Ribonuclease J C-terminal domain-containing protein n=1 Tax=Mycoplasma suis (strain KI_3806) TaxID=708248 RepID=F0V2L6_MYCS3|nr:ribonuclease J [Mycoplasma suis]CBZ40897.1 conserved hypothetical protein [Mycoplasma suis KI3806]